MSLLLCWTCLTSMVPASGPVTEPAARPAQPTINRDDLNAFQVVLKKVAPKTNVEVSFICSSIILTGTADNQENLTQVLDMARAVFPGSTIVNGIHLDVPQQVQLDVVLARVDRAELRKLVHHCQISASPGETFLRVVQDRERLLKKLDTLGKGDAAQVLARPKVVTLSGRPATIVDGGEQAIVQTAANGGSTVTYKNFGTVVNILPIVMSNGKIHLEVQPEVTYPEKMKGTRYPAISTSGARVAVQMENGQTLVVGGLKALPSERVVDILNGGTVAISGLKRKEKELLILVTPHRSE